MRSGIHEPLLLKRRVRGPLSMTKPSACSSIAIGAGCAAAFTPSPYSRVYLAGSGPSVASKSSSSHFTEPSSSHLAVWRTWQGTSRLSGSSRRTAAGSVRSPRLKGTPAVIGQARPGAAPCGWMVIATSPARAANTSPQRMRRLGIAWGIVLMFFSFLRARQRGRGSREARPGASHISGAMRTPIRIGKTHPGVHELRDGPPADEVTNGPVNSG